MPLSIPLVFGEPPAKRSIFAHVHRVFQRFELPLPFRLLFSGQYYTSTASSSVSSPLAAPAPPKSTAS